MDASEHEPLKVFVAGATGAIGSPLVHQLLEAGHHVTAMTRKKRSATLELRGANCVVADGLDASAVHRAVTEAKPDVVVHQMTAIGEVDLRRFESSFVQTNRLRF